MSSGARSLFPHTETASDAPSAARTRTSVGCTNAHHSAVPRLFIESDQRDGDRVVVRGAHARHFAGPLRVRMGDSLIMVEDGVREHVVRVTEVNVDTLVAEIESTRSLTNEPTLQLHVLHGLIRDFGEVVAAVSEAGAIAIHPIAADRSVPQLN